MAAWRVSLWTLVMEQAAPFLSVGPCLSSMQELVSLPCPQASSSLGVSGINVLLAVAVSGTEGFEPC